MAKRKLLWFVAAFVLLGAGAYFLGTSLAPKRALAGTVLNNPVEVTGFDLVATDGQEVDLAADFRDSVTLVFFGYTRCPDVCPLTMARLASVYEQLGAPDDLEVVMVTVDPGFDTPDVLGEYVARYHPDFIGLSGSNSQIARVARAFFIGYAGADSNIAHTDVVGVVDRRGQLRYIYGQDIVVRLADDVPELLRSL